MPKLFSSHTESSPIQKVEFDILKQKQVELYIKRDDLLHNFVSGNKWRKLKYNILHAIKQGHDTLLTFGGAYSNHIHATASAAHHYNIKSIGIIRGEEHLPLNPTLLFAKKHRMLFHYMNRETYRNKASSEVLDQLKRQYGDFYLVPEGGTNELAVKGTAEIVKDIGIEFSHICCACGTGGTIAGIINELNGEKEILGFPVLKGATFLYDDISSFLKKDYKNYQLMLNYHFGGYAKIKADLIHFMDEFTKDTAIPLDPVYTGKMLYGTFDLIKNDHFPKGSKIIAVHTGGLQGIEGMRTKMEKLRL